MLNREIYYQPSSPLIFLGFALARSTTFTEKKIITEKKTAQEERAEQPRKRDMKEARKKKKMLRDQQNAITYTIKCPALFFLNNTNNVLEKKKIAFVECWEEATASQYEVGDVEVEVDRVKRRSAERDQKNICIKKVYDFTLLCCCFSFISFFPTLFFFSCFSRMFFNNYTQHIRAPKTTSSFGYFFLP